MALYETDHQMRLVSLARTMSFSVGRMEIKHNFKVSVKPETDIVSERDIWRSKAQRAWRALHNGHNAKAFEILDAPQ